MLSLIFAGSSGTEARLYLVVGTSSGWVTPSADEVKAGTLAGGAVWAGNVAAPTESGTFDVGAVATGLQPGVRYTAAAVWSNGELDSNVYVFDFQTVDKKVGVGGAGASAMPSYDEDHARMLDREAREEDDIMMIVAALVQRGVFHAWDR